MTRRAVVTGGGGFIGRHLIKALTGAGWRVHGLDLCQKPGTLTCTWTQADILDLNALKTVFDGADVVFHLAALAHLGLPRAQRYYDVNVTGTKMVLDAANARNVGRLIVTSSATALTPVGHDQPIHAEDRPALKTLAGPYARSKRLALDSIDDAVRAGQAVYTLYPTVPVGPEDYNKTAPTQMLELFAFNPPPAYLPTSLNLVRVEDVAQAHLAAALYDGRRRNFLLEGEWWAMETLLALVERISGTPISRRRVPYALAWLSSAVTTAASKVSGSPPLASLEGLRLAKTKVDFSSKATHEDLGWTAGPVEPGLIKALLWLFAQRVG